MWVHLQISITSLTCHHSELARMHPLHGRENPDSPASTFNCERRIEADRTRWLQLRDTWRVKHRELPPEESNIESSLTLRVFSYDTIIKKLISSTCVIYLEIPEWRRITLSALETNDLIQDCIFVKCIRNTQITWHDKNMSSMTKYHLSTPSLVQCDIYICITFIQTFLISF